MSRILDALRKQEGGRPSPQPVPRSHKPKPQQESAKDSPPVITGPAEPAPGPERPMAPAALTPQPPTAAATPARRAPAVAPSPDEPQIAETRQAGPIMEPRALPVISEDFHNQLSGLRLQVDTALSGRRPRVLMFASAASGEGSSTVAASFARVVAQDLVSRVLLVDANARRPGLALYFGLPEGPGLPQVLHSGYPFAECAKPVERPNLQVMPSMPGQAIAGNLYAQQLVRTFLNQYGANYDYVIFDAPPVLESPETTVLGGAVDTSLLVVRAAHTKGDVVNRAIDSLAKAGVPVLGVVLNRRQLDIPEFLYKRI